jgi:catechol 2,3-dioxygenase-like lactoylglutathione lyase family enzyme
MTAPGSSPVTASKLGYVGFETPDVDRMVEYYTRVLDFVLVERSTDQPSSPQVSTTTAS